MGSHQSVATGSKLWFGVPCFGVPRNENVSLQTEVLPRRSHRLRRAGEIAHGRPAGRIPHAVHAPAAGVPGEARAAVPRLALPRGDGPHGLRALGGPTARPPGRGRSQRRRGARLTWGRSAGYRVSWEVYGRNGSRLTRTLSNATREYKVQGLSSLTTYTVDVTAATAAGAGPATSSTISSGVPPGQWGTPRGPCSLPVEALGLGGLASLRRCRRGL